MQVQTTNTTTGQARVAPPSVLSTLGSVSTPSTSSTPAPSTSTTASPNPVASSASNMTTKPGVGAVSSPVASVTTTPVTQDPAALLAEKGIDLGPVKKKSRGKKQIPTVVGLLVLFVALISGVLLFGQGTGVFAPRATPQTTPKNIRITNVTDKTFTISFYTDESTVAFVEYGEAPNDLKKQASDDRDQLSGIVKDYRLHHITVRGLDPDKTYYYELGTGSNTFDNEGQPYSITTAAKPTQSPSSNQTIYGNVLTQAKVPAEGAVVYLYSEGIGSLSSLVKASGSFGISLSNAFTADKKGYANLTDESEIEVKAQGIELNSFANIKTTVAQAQPVADLMLAQGTTASDAASVVEDPPDVDKEALLASSTSAMVDDATMASGASLLLGEDGLEGASESSVGSMSSLTAALGTSETSESAMIAAEPVVLDLDELDETASPAAVVIDTTQPQIKATLPANTVVRVVIHSDTQIDETYQTDENGNLIVDVAALGQDLEPGEHTASYSYIDPVTGEEVTKTYSFTVAPDATRQLAQAATPTPSRNPTATPVPSIPYGSGNPFVPSVSPSATLSPAVTTTPSATPSIGSAGAIIATTSGQYSAGSIGTTLALLGGGIFFVLAGVWSYALARSFELKK